MKSQWSDADARRVVEECGGDEPHGLRTYSARLLGREPALVLHGGGNSSYKGKAHNIYDEEIPALFVKASGHDLATIGPAGHVALDLIQVGELEQIDGVTLGRGPLTDRQLAGELRRCLLDPDDPDPSIETLVHALLPGRFIDHTHADAVLALTNRPGGEEAVLEAMGDDLIVLPYYLPGFELAVQSLRAWQDHPHPHGVSCMVWMHHGILTWGKTARESYEAMIDRVSRAEAFLEAERGRGASIAVPTSPTTDSPTTDSPTTKSMAIEGLDRRLETLAPLLRGALALPPGCPADTIPERMVVLPFRDADLLAFLDQPGAREMAVSPPLTTDHLIRVRPWPLWLELAESDWENADSLRRRLHAALDTYRQEYEAYLGRHPFPHGLAPFPGTPRVVLAPGLGILAAGRDTQEATIARDIAEQTLRVKAGLLRAGVAYRGLDEDHLFAMEYRLLQHRKLAPASMPALRGSVALITGAAGAIGAGVSRVLLEAGCHLVATDVAEEALGTLAAELGQEHPGRVHAVPMDVTDPESVCAGFAAAARRWGGVDLVVINAGAAHVAELTELELADFERLERINVHGTLLVLAEAGRRLKHQGSGGDVVLISTKNVFAPGASFGAYSATKAAAHQLARIASQELAPHDVRVNMVAPDAVFGEGERRSGLWKEVGPSRMQARGLDEEGLEDYYKNRNLLKTRVTAEHVGQAVLFFARRLTPTTGATLPVDGGLPDATPR